MAKLYFHYSTMNAGKSTLLLQASHNTREHGMATHLLTARLDGRAGPGRITSRIGIAAEADTYDTSTDLHARIAARLAEGPVACVFLDGAQVQIGGNETNVSLCRRHWREEISDRPVPVALHRHARPQTGPGVPG